MRTAGVVLHLPGIHRDLRGLQTLERAVRVEQLILDAAMPPFDFPGGVGDRGLVSRWVMPLCRQIRSKSTSAGRGAPNRPVNCLPLSLSTSSGTPYSAIASQNAVHTARALARGTTLAITE
jgi:hypothetical protein